MCLAVSVDRTVIAKAFVFGFLLVTRPRVTVLALFARLSATAVTMPDFSIDVPSVLKSLFGPASEAKVLFALIPIVVVNGVMMPQSVGAAGGEAMPPMLAVVNLVDGPVVMPLVALRVMMKQPIELLVVMLLTSVPLTA